MNTGKPATSRFRWRFARLVRRAGIGVLVGMTAGAIAGGIGARIAMRLVAITAGPAAHGLLTENRSRVGEITASGTAGVLVAGALIGIFGGLLYVALEAWLRRFGSWRGLVFGLLLLVFAAAVVNPSNHDFRAFGSPVLNVVLFGVLFVPFGLLVAPLALWADQRFPAMPPARHPRLHTWCSYTLLVGAALLAIPPIALALFNGPLLLGDSSYTSSNGSGGVVRTRRQLRR